VVCMEDQRLSQCMTLCELLSLRQGIQTAI
jgi:hypothetical protein